MADAEGTVGCRGCKGKSGSLPNVLDRQAQSGNLLIQAAGRNDRFGGRSFAAGGDSKIVLWH